MIRVHWNEHRKREELTLAGVPFEIIEARAIKLNFYDTKGNQ